MLFSARLARAPYARLLRRASGTGDRAPKLVAAEAALLRARAAAETTRAGADAAATASRAGADAAATASRAGADAAATASRAGADAAATALRADAEVVRSSAAAAAIATRAAAYAAAVRAGAASSFAYAAAAVAALCVSLALMVDLYVHEEPGYISWRVRRALRATAGAGVPASLAADPALPVEQSPLVLGFRPLMLLGPTGCGKSTLLARLAYEAAATRTPVVLVRWRVSESAVRAADGTAGVPADAALALASERLFEQIGYPRRRALVISFFKNGFFFMGQKTQADLTPPETRDRLLHALRVLFSAAAAVQAERVAAGVPAFEAAPVLLFDEAHDLVKDDRLARAGGAAIFRHLAVLLIGHCVDGRAVRAVVAGSSVELDAAFRAAAPYHSRWRHYELADPAPDVVVAALEARGYAAGDARALVAECGTRLRLLEEPLQRGAGAVRAADIVAAAADAGDAAVAALFHELSAADAAALTRALDAAAAADAAAGAGGAPAAAARPGIHELPAAVRAGEAFAGVVYADLRGRAHFQSRPVAHAWARARARAAAGA